MPLKRKIKIGIGMILFMLFFIVPFLPGIKQFVSIPNEIVTFQNSDPLSILPNDHDITISTSNSHVTTDNTMLYPQSSGVTEVFLEKANIPVKKMNISVLSDKKIIPGGESIGVQLHTTGVLVVGHHLITKKNTSPAETADILVGDVIVEMNGNKISKLEDVKPIVKKAGANNKEIKVTLKRGKEVVKTHLKPILNKRDNSYQIGLYIRDSATGIGTVSFYEEGTGLYGALGHIISDADTKKPIELYKGKIVPSTVTSIDKGNQGVPGEKQASFSMKDAALGNITKNSPFGIFGTLDADLLKNQGNKKPMPVALPTEVKKGPAQILTVIEGNKIEKFDVEVINSIPQSNPATKGMVIKVTDKELLEKTGGIVQGMSGSPIIQNGKIIGAVTHVFVNDPTSGYGIHVAWMLEEAGINIWESTKKAS